MKVFIVCLLWLLTTGMAVPLQPPSKEYQIKAVFLFNFTQFVEWPDNTFPESTSPLIIGVFGEDPFGTYLSETVIGEKINGHPLAVQYYRNVQEIKNCHILFINPGKADQLNQVLTSLKGRSILTVSDSPSFTRRGGMIQFITEDNKIRIQIDPKIAKAADLTISSKLLRLAEIVTSKNN